MKRTLGSLMAAAILLTACGTSTAAPATTPPDPPVPAELVALPDVEVGGYAPVYRAAHPDIDFPDKIMQLAEVFDVEDTRPVRWRIVGTVGDNHNWSGGYGDLKHSEHGHTGQVSMFNLYDAGVDWVYNTPLWIEHNPMCRQCPPVTGITADEALQRTLDDMAVISPDLDLAWDVATNDTKISVYGSLQIDGLPVALYDWAFVYGGNAELYTAQGYLLDLQHIGWVTLTAPEAALASHPLTNDPDEHGTARLAWTANRDTDGTVIITPAYTISIDGRDLETTPAYNQRVGVLPLADASRS